ncbi:PVC-type heme-binding CxxCH protein [Tautonia plasticadhaerens]|uniref:Cytochrome c n=1 Tax=Tautonia plasticadhaerens TaxID=2527974 RepID=A0A518GZ38_9BACT|nr:PVC-type heme-binding CxxCH protein [Tautonia plasticadhaerens]QDV33837.1 Cytochrome c [Tautonia plasticadhaerens]
MLHRSIRRFLPLPLLLVVSASAAPTPLDEDLARELPRIPPTEAADAPATFRVQHGFSLAPVAVEPLITDPVDASYDADGRLYVVEMRGYPYPEDVPTGRVRLIDDADDDGRFDSGTTFLDDLSWPTAVVPYDGGVFIAVAPEILYAKDTDGDGVADVREVAFSGFGTSNVQGLVNGLLWGPDGWIYGVSSSNGADRVVNHLDPGADLIPLGTRDFRFKPDGSAFEPVSGGGQNGHAFDDWGHRFTCNNSNHIRQVVLPADALARNPDYAASTPIIDIAAEGAAAPVFRISPVEPWRIVRTRQRAADPEFRRRLPPNELVPSGFFTSATGVTIYRGTAFGPDYLGNAFIGDVGGNLVHRKHLAVDGSTFEATRAEEGVEFAASTDNWFRPVNFRNTPDGTLLVLDMYRETIEHPASIPEPIKQHLDLTSGHDRGRIYDLVPADFEPRERPRLSRAPDAELVPLLADPDSWWRETAQRLLIERDARDAIPALRALAADRPTALGRMHALWTLSALGGLTAGDLLPALSDAEPRVRENAARLAEPLVADADAAADDLRDALLALARDEDPMVRFQAALSTGVVPGPEAIDALAAVVSEDSGDRWTRSAVMTALDGRADALLSSLIDLPGFLDRPEATAWLGELALLVGASGDRGPIDALIARIGHPEARPAVVLAILNGLGEGLRRSGGDPAVLTSGPAGEALAPVFERAAEAASAGGDGPDRIEAIRLLALAPSGLALETLPELLDGRQPSPVQLAALRALGDRAEPEVGPILTAAWRGFGPSSRREATEVLFARPDRLSALLDAMQSGAIPPGQLDPARRDQLLQHRDASVRGRAEQLLAGTSASSTRAEVIASYRDALSLEGGPDRGQVVFRKACATCHKAEGFGAEVGPDLATVTNRTPEDLVIHILDPNREVLPQYLNYNVATVDGRVLSGQVASESPTSITLKRAEGVTDVVPRDQIDEFASTGQSLMPEGLEEEVTVEQMADLIAYLKGLQGG